MEKTWLGYCFIQAWGSLVLIRIQVYWGACQYLGALVVLNLQDSSRKRLLWTNQKYAYLQCVFILYTYQIISVYKSSDLYIHEYIYIYKICMRISPCVPILILWPFPSTVHVPPGLPQAQSPRRSYRCPVRRETPGAWSSYRVSQKLSWRMASNGIQCVYIYIYYIVRYSSK